MKHGVAGTRAWRGALLPTATMLCLFVLAGPGGAASFVPGPGSPLSDGGGAAVAVGDFNGDSKLDLVSGPFGNSATFLSVLLGDGTGRFSPAPGSPFSTGSGGVPTGTNSLAVDDFNADGKLDIVVANSGAADDVSILLGDGNGAFSPAPGSPFSTGGINSFSVAVGDFNGDGKPDLAVANAGAYPYGQEETSNVSVLLGDGNGAFTPASGSPYSSGSIQPDSVAVGDLNGDGSLDVAVANGKNGNGLLNVSVLLGDGKGGLSSAPGSPFTSGGRGAVAVAVVDFNGDRKPDVAVTNQLGGVSILLGDGLGQLIAGPGSPFSTGGSAPDSIEVDDFNRDGRLDVAAADLGSNDVAVLTGDGLGQLSPAEGSPYPVGATNPRSIAAGDFNGDGLPDLATANRDTFSFQTSVSVLINSPSRHACRKRGRSSRSRWCRSTPKIRFR